MTKALRRYFSKLGRKSADLLTQEQRTDRARKAGQARADKKARENAAFARDSHANRKLLPAKGLQPK